MNTANLSAESRRVHRALLESYVATGAIPTAEILAQATEAPVDTIPAWCRELEEAGYIHFDASGQVVCLFPFSPVRTPTALIINGQIRYAMCPVDALGIPAMLGRAVTVKSRCAHCGAPIRIDAAPDTIVTVEPDTTLVVVGRWDDQPAEGTCCNLTGFACSTTCANRIAEGLPHSEIRAPASALLSSAAFFGEVVTAETLPANFLTGDEC